MNKIKNKKGKKVVVTIENKEVINISLSRELRRKYNHKENKSYENIYELLQKEEIDEYVIGYVVTGNRNVIRRHAWGIKDSKIIDTSLKLKEVRNKIKYFEAFSISKDTEEEIIWSDISKVGYKDEIECEAFKRMERYLQSLMIIDEMEYIDKQCSGFSSRK